MRRRGSTIGSATITSVKPASVPPVLLLGFNRPDSFRTVIDSLRQHAPPIVYVSLDGPREGHPTDRVRVNECKSEVDRIDWSPSLHTNFRESNAGLKIAVPAAVTWALEDHDSVIVIEDDVIVGPDFLDFASTCLDMYRDRDDIWHISGYNVVPEQHLAAPNSPARLSRFPESIAWATWKRAWEHYDPALSWAEEASTSDLRQVLGSNAGALRWKQIFRDVRRQRVSTWAYRWIGSMWSQNAYCISPNRNLTTYAGYADGTHTRRRARWQELPVEPVPDGPLDGSIALDLIADRYLGRNVFRGTVPGVVLGVPESVALEVLRRRG